MSELPSRSAVLGMALACLLLTSGCIGSLPGRSTTTESGRAASTTVETTGETSTNLTAEEVLQRVQTKQRSIDGYSATIGHQTEITLTNGSSIVRNRTDRLAVRYGNDTALAFYRELSFDGGDRRRITVANDEHYVSYDVINERYRYDERTGDHFGAHYSLDELRWVEKPEVLLRENHATYEGIETVNGREAYLISFAAKNQNEPGVTQTAYFDKQTYWFDTRTGVLVKHVAHKPVRRFNHSVSEIRDPENETGSSRDDDGEDAVYLEHKVRTTTVANLTVNPDFPSETFTFAPPSDAQPVGEPNDTEPEDD